MNGPPRSGTLCAVNGLGPSRTYDAYLVDVDGVLTRGAHALPGAADALRMLCSRGRTLLLTNNSTRSRRELASHLVALGFDVASDDVLPTSTLAAEYLLGAVGPSALWVLGEAGLRDELAAAGHSLALRPRDAQWVVVGMDRNLTYEKLNDALQALRGGALLLATNEDATFPTRDGVVPGAGAVVGALRGMGFAPEAVMGKPSRHAFEIARRALDVSADRILVVGDRLDTDVAGGNAAGMDTALVLTGVSTRLDARDGGIRPTWIAADLAAAAMGHWDQSLDVGDGVFGEQ